MWDPLEEKRREQALMLQEQKRLAERPIWQIMYDSMLKPAVDWYEADVKAIDQIRAQPWNTRFTGKPPKDY